MDHKPPQQLQAEMAAAQTQVTIGGRYAHYKHPSKVYRVKELGVLEANNEICVIYQAEYGGTLTFVRPLSEWLETVEWQGRSLPRFTKL